MIESFQCSCLKIELYCLKFRQWVCKFFVAKIPMVSQLYISKVLICIQIERQIHNRVSKAQKKLNQIYIAEKYRT